MRIAAVVGIDPGEQAESQRKAIPRREANNRKGTVLSNESTGKAGLLSAGSGHPDEPPR